MVTSLFVSLLGFLYIAMTFKVIKGRILHYKSMLDGGDNFKYRVNGMKLTIIPITILLVLNLFIFITEFKEKI